MEVELELALRSDLLKALASFEASAYVQRLAVVGQVLFSYAAGKFSSTLSISNMHISLLYKHRNTLAILPAMLQV